MIFYNNHADFQQTNTIGGSIGVGTGGVTEAFKNRVIMPLSHVQSADPSCTWTRNGTRLSIQYDIKWRLYEPAKFKEPSLYGW